MPVRFANVGGFSLSDFDGPVRSWSSLLPLGWDQQANLEQIHSYKAEVALQPHYMQVHTFDWTPGQEQVHDLEGIDLRITPVAGLAQVYKIEINTHGSTRYPLHYFGGVEGRMQWQDVGLGPAWLTPGERNLFNAYQQNKGSLSWRLELDEQPEQISVYLVLPEAQPSARREITFISPEVFARDPEMPPLEQHYLFGPPWQYRGKTTLDFNPEQPAMLDESGQSGQSAQAVLPGEWSVACTLEVTDAEPVNGHALEWRPVDECREQECDNLYLHQQQAYELATDDGEQRYFYGREVSSRLSCQGVPQWVELAYSPAEQPWLIPLAALPDVDREQLVSEFLQRYRFYDAKGEVLGLFGPEGRALPLNGTRLADALVDGDRLRLGGRVSRITHVALGAEPVIHDWTLSFPSLP
ncbi:MAG: hypothetical protein GYB41_15880 [Oceanospirillales bacterium]|nr:hypothetical protein [Oceanospirillales bacterium]